jgi:hypothetical protein
MTSGSWFYEEPPRSEGFLQAVLLLRAGMRRTKAMILLSVLLAAALAGGVLWVRYSYSPEYVLRVVEPSRTPTGMPQPRRQLAEYVRMAVFTNERLFEVMRHHGLYQSLAARNPRAALQSFRDDIDIEVRENYFVEARPVGAAPRSARLVVSYRNSDSDVASRVTRELGELVVAREQAMRRDDAARAADAARHQVDDAREALEVRRSTVASMQAEIDGSAGVAPEQRVTFLGLLGTLPALELRQDECERREASLALGAALERRGIGMLFEVVDDALLPSNSGAQLGRAVVAGAAFVLGLPLLAVAVGAFGTRRTSNER